MNADTGLLMVDHLALYIGRAICYSTVLEGTTVGASDAVKKDESDKAVFAILGEPLTCFKATLLTKT
jgi:hypothetical protein